MTVGISQSRYNARFYVIAQLYIITIRIESDTKLHKNNNNVQNSI